MKILAIDKILPKATPKKIKEISYKEMIQAWKHYKSGFLREFYFRIDRPGAVLVLESESTIEAQKILSELPIVKEGLVEFEIIPLGYFLPIESLFSKDSILELSLE